MARGILHGVALSPGVAYGKIFFLNRKPQIGQHHIIQQKRVPYELARFKKACETVVNGMQNILNSLPIGLHHREFIELHILICQDTKLHQLVAEQITKQHKNAIWALEDSLEILTKAFKEMEAPYLQERAQDLNIVCRKILEQLQGTVNTPLRADDANILMAFDISASEALECFNSSIAAFVTEQGGITSHSGFIAQSLRIPAIAGVRGLESFINEGDIAIVDGFSGQIIISPNDEEVKQFRKRRRQLEAFNTKHSIAAKYPAETKDGKRIHVAANINVFSQAKTALDSGCEGVGLVRTEFGVISLGSLPSEGALFEEYKRLVELFTPQTIVFRTFDVGADKVLASHSEVHEENPALGLRAMRFCLQNQDFFRRQIRAILRASAFGPLSIMFPFIATVEEVRRARSIMNEAIQELESEHILFDKKVPVGVMIELPAAAVMADVIAREVDFFSIGTNDLIQYTMGADRHNRNVAHLHKPLHPAILRFIKHIVDTGHAAGISVSICGEMASDVYCVPLLLGMQVDTLSVSATSIPLIKHIVRSNTMRSCNELLASAISASTSNGVYNAAIEHAYTHYAKDIPFFPIGISSYR